MNKLKRLVCIIMAALIIVSAPIASYNEAQAAELAGTMEILQALFELFGVTAGLGHQPDFFSQSSFDDFATAVSNGHVYHMDEYGDVDFSDNDSVMDWLDWANGIDEYITSSGWSSMTKYDTAIKAGAGIIDYASYKISGTSATTAMHSYIDELVGDYNGSSEALVEDIRDTFSVITREGAIVDDDDEETKQKKSMTRFKIFNALASGLLLTSGHNLTALVALKHPEASDFSEYDAAFEDAYFDGTYTTNADGQYVYKIRSDCTIYESGKRYPWVFDTTYPSRLAGYFSDDCIFFIDSGGGVSLPVKDLGKSFPFIRFSSFYSVNIPLYPSLEAALAALNADDFSDAENIIQNPYRSFKENVISPVARYGKHLDKWIMSPEYLKKLPSTIKPVLGAASSSAGMTDNIDAIDDAIKEIAPAVTADPDPVPDDSADYSGILGKILAAINTIIAAFNTLPSKLVTAFSGKFMTADALKKAFDAMPELFAKAFADALTLPLVPVIAAIDALPRAMIDGLALPNVLKDAIASVFPRASDVAAAIISIPDVFPKIITDAVTTVFPRVKEVEDAIIGFPAAVADAIADVVIKIPEIEIPEIVVPEIVVPAITAPAVNLTLNPTYDITVANDYTGLDDVISKAVASVLTECFVPDKILTMEKIGELEKYFKFKDDIVIAVDDLKTMLFGITPSPILKIPIGRPASERYNYGTGNYIIIDISWYAPYKQLGDKIILAITWAFFLWHTFIKLPGIISGTEGSIVSIDKSYQRYERIQSYKKE